MKRIFQISIVTTACLIFSLFAFGENTVINIPEKAVVIGEEIFLGDIAEISGHHNDKIDELHRLYLGKSPIPKSKKNINTSFIKDCLLKNNFLDVTLVGEKSVEILRDYMEVTPEKIKLIVTDYFNNNDQWLDIGGEISAVRVNRSVLLPVGNLSWDISLPENVSFIGNMPVTIGFTVDGRKERQITASVDLFVKNKIVVAVKPIPKRSYVTAEDITLKAVSASKSTSRNVQNADELIGMRVKKNILPGEAFTLDILEFPTLISRGDNVNIIAEANGLMVSGRGQAKQSGAKGDIIKVLNLDSNKLVYAEVVGTTNVKVKF